MPQNVSEWWTDEKVKDTVTSSYVHSHLRPNEAELLTQSVFGELSDDTYLEWILTRARRFFLALLDAGVPDQIFGIIDDSYDDEDLPIPEDEVPALRLSPHPDRPLERRFFKAQFKYLIRVVGDGEHIRYAREETIPVVVLANKLAINNVSKESLDKVILPSHSQSVFSRKRIKLSNGLSENDILTEIAGCQRYVHEHVFSIFGSYTTTEGFFVLFTPAIQLTLKSFLNDPPKAFDALMKPDRRRTLLNWPHCMASGLAWLHTNGRHHGCIRPSRVYVDEKFNICLGQFDGDGVLGSSVVKDDIEAYQYAAPERWKRSVTVQTTGSSRVVLPSGGRAGRKVTTGTSENASLNSGSESSAHGPKLNTMRPTSTSYAFIPTAKGNRSRLRIGVAINRSIDPIETERSVETRQSHRRTTSRNTIRATQDDDTGTEAHSVVSSHSSDNGRTSRARGNPVFATGPELRTAIVQTWASAQHDMFAADVFALGTIIMDILTTMCKCSCSAFAKHRSAKNRVAGRGGGVADASFHANLGQVATWAQMLQKESEKRIKKEDGSMFKAVGPILQVVMQCLEREPNYRLTSEDLAKKLEEHIRDFAGTNDLHCVLDLDPVHNRPRSQGRETPEMERRNGATRSEKNNQESQERELATKVSPVNYTPENQTTTPTSQRFNFDFDGASETIVDDHSTDEGLSAIAGYRTPRENDELGVHMTRGMSSLAYRAKRVSWAKQEDEDRIEPHPPALLESAILQDRFRLHSTPNRNSYQFPTPPSQSPNRRLPPLPGSTGTKRPPRALPHTKIMNRASRAMENMMERTQHGADGTDRRHLSSLRE